MTKIMLVEDDKSLREIYGVRLLAEGYEIISAGDGEEALAMAVKEKPGLIISDVMMPKISGFDMLDILRATPETKGIKVIMMTALSSDDQRERGETLGADKYLVKSQVGIEDVVRTVHEVLADAPIAAAAPRFDTTPPVIEPTPEPAPPPTAPVSAPEPVAPTPVTQPVAPAETVVSTLPPQPASYAADPVVATPHSVTVAPTPTAVPVVPEPVAPALVTTPEPATPTPAPAPVPQPATPALTPSTAPVAPVLPQPTAPFSTPAPTSLGERVINPPATPTEHQNIGLMMEEELTNPLAVPAAPQPTTPQPATPVLTPDLSAQMVQELNDGSNTAPTPPPQF